jgi:hypothetical protein
MLRTHPQIFMPDRKEPWFFVPELRARPPMTLEEYLALFDSAEPGQRMGEATPSCLFSHSAAARIAELQPDARIIAILREPASFLRSLHLQFVQTDVETEADFGRAIALEAARREGKAIPRNSARPQMLVYSEHVRYVEQLRRYHAVFAAEQVLVLIYEDYRRDNEGTLRQIFRFLDVDDTHSIEVLQANPTVRVRAHRTQQLVRSLYLGRGPASRAAKRAVKGVTSSRMRHAALRMMRSPVFYGKPPAVDEQLMGQLRARFKGEVVALSEYLGRDLVALWGYGDID